MRRKDIIKKAHALEALIRIGKKGITESLLDEIKKQLKKKKIIKIKLLKSYTADKDTEKDINSITEKTNSKLVEKRGSTFTIFTE